MKARTEMGCTTEKIILLLAQEKAAKNLALNKQKLNKSPWVVKISLRFLQSAPHKISKT
jgi:hypothetical protein